MQQMTLATGTFEPYHDGELVDQGGFDELVAKNELFRRTVDQDD